MCWPQTVPDCPGLPCTPMWAMQPWGRFKGMPWGRLPRGAMSCRRCSPSGRKVSRGHHGAAGTRAAHVRRGSCGPVQGKSLGSAAPGPLPAFVCGAGGQDASSSGLHSHCQQGALPLICH